MTATTWHSSWPVVVATPVAGLRRWMFHAFATAGRLHGLVEWTVRGLAAMMGANPVSLDVNRCHDLKEFPCPHIALVGGGSWPPRPRRPVSP
ncbi:hypothetical protein ABT369_57745, partial [Dactylosporangium sp. NPDC000244]|uniref:hypothetical protein n=1 Tax=Dactylosporangium sp. NPDC000244 TaxID=3154365 RepID=UPI003320B36B